MKHNIVAPEVGESITEVSILKWAKKEGEAVKAGEILLEIESDKATVEVAAESDGALHIIKNDGETIPVGEVIGEIDDSAKGTVSAEKPAPAAPKNEGTGAVAAAAPQPVTNGGTPMSPSVRKAVAEGGLDVNKIPGTGKGGRVTKEDVVKYQENPKASSSIPTKTDPDRPGDRRVKMSNLRKRIAQRLVQAQHEAAILTTFNEVNMKPVMDIRKQHKENFKQRFGLNLSFMSFFTRACTKALRLIPEINASIEGDDIIYHDYCDVGIAVGTDRGLVVPIIRGAEKKTFMDLEQSLAELAAKARAGKLSIADMTGGTFTISNGGTYGSMLSTPILNPPQSGILGMHNIQDRPMVIDGKIEIRPVMLLALSYDHRIVDGKGAVTFLVKLKEFLEDPSQLDMEFLNA